MAGVKYKEFISLVQPFMERQGFAFSLTQEKFSRQVGDALQIVWCVSEHSGTSIDVFLKVKYHSVEKVWKKILGKSPVYSCSYEMPLRWIGPDEPLLLFLDSPADISDSAQHFTGLWTTMETYFAGTTDKSDYVEKHLQRGLKFFYGGVNPVNMCGVNWVCYNALVIPLIIGSMDEYERVKSEARHFWKKQGDKYSSAQLESVIERLEANLQTIEAMTAQLRGA